MHIQTPFQQMATTHQNPQPKTETTAKGRKKNIMKSRPFCMPRIKSTRKSNKLSPMWLLDRFREAVFRLIMLSALTKATQEGSNSNSNSNISRSAHAQRSYYAHEHDPPYSEAVADCIEFIKRSATTDENRDSTASSSSIDASPEFVIPVPVI